MKYIDNICCGPFMPICIRHPKNQSIDLLEKDLLSLVWEISDERCECEMQMATSGNAMLNLSKVLPAAEYFEARVRRHVLRSKYLID